MNRDLGEYSSRRLLIPPGREGMKRVSEKEAVTEKQYSCPLFLIVAFSSFQELNLENPTN